MNTIKKLFEVGNNKRELNTKSYTKMMWLIIYLFIFQKETKEINFYSIFKVDYGNDFFFLENGRIQKYYVVFHLVPHFEECSPSVCCSCVN